MEGSKTSLIRIMTATGLLICLWVALMIWLLDLWTPFRRQPHMEWQPDTTQAETITVAMDYDYPPYSFMTPAGELAGFDVELVYALGKAMRVNIKVLSLPWSDAREAVLQGKADLLAGLECVVENMPDFELSVPLHNDPYVAFGGPPLSGISALYGKRLAVLEGSASYFSLLKPYLTENKLTLYKSYSEAFSSVINKKNEYVVARYSVGRRIFAQLNTKPMPVALELPNNYLCIGAKGGNTELINRVNAALITLSRDGVRDRLAERWLDRYVRLITWEDVILAHKVDFVLMGCGIILLLMTGIAVSRFRIVRLRQNALQRTLEYQSLIVEATRGLYENVLEVDVTHDRAGNDETRRTIERMGLPPDAPYSALLREVANRQIDPGHRRLFLDTFSLRRVLEAYAGGEKNLSCELRAALDEQTFHWLRVSARIFFLPHDNSVRMLIFRQNINAEKQRELSLSRQASQDALSGLYNKAATEKLVTEALASQNFDTSQLAFFIIDIDNFKYINDTFGHAAGDKVLADFAHRLKGEFRNSDIVGRIGGDEFVVVCTSVSSRNWMEKKAADLVARLRTTPHPGGSSQTISASVGAALAPGSGKSFQELYSNADKALYQTKKRGKNGFTIHQAE